MAKIRTVPGIAEIGRVNGLQAYFSFANTIVEAESFPPSLAADTSATYRFSRPTMVAGRQPAATDPNGVWLSRAFAEPGASEGRRLVRRAVSHPAGDVTVTPTGRIADRRAPAARRAGRDPGAGRRHRHPARRRGQRPRVRVAQRDVHPRVPRGPPQRRSPTGEPSSACAPGSTRRSSWRRSSRSSPARRSRSSGRRRRRPRFATRLVPPWSRSRCSAALVSAARHRGRGSGHLTSHADRCTRQRHARGDRHHPAASGPPWRPPGWAPLSWSERCWPSSSRRWRHHSDRSGLSASSRSTGRRGRLAGPRATGGLAILVCGLALCAMPAYRWAKAGTRPRAATPLTVGERRRRRRRIGGSRGRDPVRSRSQERDVPRCRCARPCSRRRRRSRS